MEPYNFEKFVQEIQNMNYTDIMLHCQKRCRVLEESSYGVKGAAQRREQGSIQLAEDIKGVLFWIGNGIKPFGLSQDKFQMLRPICINLIEKGQLKTEAIEILK